MYCLLLVIAAVLFLLLVQQEWKASKSSPGFEHINTATAACMNGHHWNCSGTVHFFFKSGTIPCSCPHHLEP